MAALFSEARARYEQNAAVFVQEAAALDVYARDTLTQVPEHCRILLTAHDAFGYFGIAYDFEVLGIRGISTVSEAVLNRNGLALMALSVPPG